MLEVAPLTKQTVAKGEEMTFLDMLFVGGLMLLSYYVGYSFGFHDFGNK